MYCIYLLVSSPEPWLLWSSVRCLSVNNNDPWCEISNNVVCATSNGSDQPAHTRRLIRAFASCWNILWLLSYFLVSKFKRILHRLVEAQFALNNSSSKTTGWNFLKRYMDGTWMILFQSCSKHFNFMQNTLVAMATIRKNFKNLFVKN